MDIINRLILYWTQTELQHEFDDMIERRNTSEKEDQERTNGCLEVDEE